MSAFIFEPGAERCAASSCRFAFGRKAFDDATLWSGNGMVMAAIAFALASAPSV